MPVIQVLSPHMADLIAAGEVVERPASVAKELCENAIDAGARKLTVEIQRGGLAFLRVTDDGCGIPASQLKTAFLRHATSKLRTERDLEAIGTLGFRGEALAAISAVSRMSVLTRTADAPIGASLSLEGGVPGEVREAGCPLGTTMVVRDLFYNTPARLKFMKKDSAEGAAVHGAVQRVALSHPEVSVRFLRDGKQEMLTPGDGKLQSAIYAVLGRDLILGSRPVLASNDDIRVSGFASLPTCCRGSRSMQFFFVNGRQVKSPMLVSALEEAYRNQKMVGKFPACVLHIEVKPNAVDVNVHPAKTEVRFTAERDIFSMVCHAVRSALEGDRSHPSLLLSGEGNRPAPSAGQPKISAPGPVRGGWSFSVPDQGLPRTPQGPDSPQPAVPPAPPSSGSTADAASPKATPQDQKPTFGFTSSASLKNLNPESTPAPSPRSGGDHAATRVPGSGAPTGSAPESDGDLPLDEIAAAFSAPIGGKAASPAVTPAPAPAQPEGPAPEVPRPAVPASAVASEETPAREPSAPTAASDPLPASGFTPEPQADSDPQACMEPEAQEVPWRVAGEVLHTYIIVEQGDTVYLIDKHAAHERMNFDRLKAEDYHPMAQSLLAPVVCRLQAEEQEVLLSHRELLEEYAFEVDELEGRLAVRQAPFDVTIQEIPGVLEDLARRLLTCGDADPAATRDELLHSMACKAAIKGGWHTEPREMEEVARAVLTGQVRFCPHGRPVAIQLTKKELEKQFKRT